MLPPHLRKPLKAREYQVDTDAKLGKAQVVVPGTATSNQAGFYCDVCDCIVKDSANYLDHINGKKRTLFPPSLALRWPLHGRLPEIPGEEWAKCPQQERNLKYALFWLTPLALQINERWASR